MTMQRYESEPPKTSIPRFQGFDPEGPLGVEEVRAFQCYRRLIERLTRVSGDEHLKRNSAMK